MSDVDGRGKRRSKERGDNAAGAVDRQRRPRVVGVAGRFGRLDVLKRPEDIEQTHRDDHREIRQDVAAAKCGDEVANHRDRCVQRRGRRTCSDWCDPDGPGDHGAQADRDHPAGNPSLEPHPAEVREHDDPEGGQPDEGTCIRAEQKAR